MVVALVAEDVLGCIAQRLQELSESYERWNALQGGHLLTEDLEAERAHMAPHELLPGESAQGKRRRKNGKRRGHMHTLRTMITNVMYTSAFLQIHPRWE